MINFQKTTLSNGIRVVSERHARSRAVSIGLFVDVGTRDESSQLAGVTHFLEHLVFKGTKKRSAFKLAKALEELGGDLNAFTTKEYTCFHSLVLKNHWRVALDVVCDLATNMQLTKENFDLEKSVVLQEIAMSYDTLEEKIFDDYLEGTFKGHPLARPILGVEASIKKMTMAQVRDYYKTRYAPHQIVIAAAGDIDHDSLVKEVEKLLGKHKSPAIKHTRKKPSVKPFATALDKPSDQVHLLWGWEATSFTDKLRFEAFIINALLGGGMTSRLFQSVREKKGLAYNIYSSLNTFTDSGLMMIYASSEAHQIQQIGKIVAAEIKRVQAKGLPPHDLKLFKTQVTGQILLGSDDVENRMNSIGINEIVMRKYKSAEQIVSEIEDVSAASIEEYLHKHFSFKNLGGALLGEGSVKLLPWLQDTLAGLRESK